MQYTDKRSSSPVLSDIKFETARFWKTPSENPAKELEVLTEADPSYPVIFTSFPTETDGVIKGPFTVICYRLPHPRCNNRYI
jgi:hypothetical protein